MSNYINYIKWVVIIAGGVLGAVFLLSAIGNSLINEVTQEVVLIEEERAGVVTAKEKVLAPYFELANLDKEIIGIDDFFGTNIVLIFWTTWNPDSADQIRILDDYLSGEIDTFFDIVTINSQEDRSVVSSFMRRSEYGVPVLLDEDGSVGDIYEARSLPSAYFINSGGIVKDIFIGPMDIETLVDKAEQAFF